MILLNTKKIMILNILKIWNHKIVSPKQFFSKIGLKWNIEWISIIKHKYNSLLFEPTIFGEDISVIHRLANDLKIMELSNEYKIFSSKFEINGGKAFNFISLTLQWNKNDEELFANNQYKRIQTKRD